MIAVGTGQRGKVKEARATIVAKGTRIVTTARIKEEAKERTDEVSKGVGVDISLVPTTHQQETRFAREQAVIIVEINRRSKEEVYVQASPWFSSARAECVPANLCVPANQLFVLASLLCEEGKKLLTKHGPVKTDRSLRH